MQVMLCSHLIEFFGEIESQEQGSRAEARSFVDHTGPLGPLSLMGFVQAHSP
jgi:hypothetical protein